jgi:hypothetical protein
MRFPDYATFKGAVVTVESVVVTTTVANEVADIGVVVVVIDTVSVAETVDWATILFILFSLQLQPPLITHCSAAFRDLNCSAFFAIVPNFWTGSADGSTFIVDKF